MAIKNFGIDLSYANVVDDYDKLLSSKYNGSKIKYAFLRLGYINKRDTLLDKHYAGLNGKTYLGFYIYSYARSVAAAKQEAHWALEQLKDLDAQFPIVFDYEDASLFTPRMTRAEYTAICKAFLDEINAAGYYAMLYCNPSFLENYADKDVLLKYPLWLAHYVKDGNQRQYGQKIWQFGTFSPAGVRGEVDANFAYEQLAKAIREGQLNKPTESRITATKMVYSWEVDEECEKLNKMGFDVDVN